MSFSNDDHRDTGWTKILSTCIDQSKFMHRNGSAKDVRWHIAYDGNLQIRPFMNLSSEDRLLLVRCIKRLPGAGAHPLEWNYNFVLLKNLPLWYLHRVLLLWLLCWPRSRYRYRMRFHFCLKIHCHHIKLSTGTTHSEYDMIIIR